MAKSLRAKTKVRYRSIKRAAVFEPVYSARTARLAKKLSATSAKSATVDHAEPPSATTHEDAPEVAMDIDSSSLPTVPAKISTSGWKGSRNEQWKQKKASKLMTKKRLGNRALVFSSTSKKSK
ncbi:uncharacterized protein V1518DRAFT_422534 [Limtongia smithiae]|uniref:uncharacterized protein n=1 Tax=Limtongia smithiae TaxID=1125753 RepID=UPI0034D01010